MGPIKYSLLPASIANLLNILLTNQSIRVTRGRMSRLMRTLLTQLYCDEKGRLFNKVFPIENPAISSLRFNELHPFFRKSVSSHFRLLMLPPIHMESIYNRDNLVLVHNSNFSLENLKLYRDIFDGMTKKMVK